VVTFNRCLHRRKVDTVPDALRAAGAAPATPLSVVPRARSLITSSRRELAQARRSRPCAAEAPPKTMRTVIPRAHSGRQTEPTSDVVAHIAWRQAAQRRYATSMNCQRPPAAPGMLRRSAACSRLA